LDKVELGPLDYYETDGELNCWKEQCAPSCYLLDNSTQSELCTVPLKLEEISWDELNLTWSISKFLYVNEMSWVFKIVYVWGDGSW
jgi:hypothetical protein